jgi:hypothetical protein
MTPLKAPSGRPNNFYTTCATAIKMKPIVVLAFLLALPIACAATINGEYLPEFSLPAPQPAELQLNELFTETVSMPLPLSAPVYGFAATGRLEFYSELGYARILLTTPDRDYLVWEASPLFYPELNNFQGICEESCGLPGLMPTGIRVEIGHASLHLSAVHYVTEPLPYAPMSEADSTLLDASQEAEKIRRLNYKLQAEGAGWTAGETYFSKLSYEEKRRIFGEDVNTQGFEYYTGGIFRIKTADAQPPPLPDSLPEEFSWAAYLGQNWITPAKDQAQGDCWNFAGTAMMEALINVHFNQPLNLDLSEQFVNCQNRLQCLYGAILSKYPNEIVRTGIVDEACLPYGGSCYSCDVCSDWAERVWKVREFGTVHGKETDYKRALITKGPFAISWLKERHAVLLYGYMHQNDELVWLIKNSASWWGENGFGKLIIPANELEKAYFLTAPYHATLHPEILCEDRDNDGYCYWGITDEKPSSCPDSCGPAKDCDDTNPLKLGFDQNLRCKTASGSIVSGCCLSPFTMHCEYASQVTECCPEEGQYAGPNQTGPTSYEDCLTNWFFYHDSEAACAIMNSNTTPNAAHCAPGCCCWHNPDESINFSFSTEPLCQGPDFEWRRFDHVVACNMAQCADIFGYRVTVPVDEDDLDGDGIKNWFDNCPEVYNPDQLDTDNDTVGNMCDNCPDVPSTWQQDTDRDGLGDVCDPDIDGDGILNEEDNCERVYNPDQKNSDKDFIGDACDNCPFVTNHGQEDSKRDGTGDACRGHPRGVKPFVSYGTLIGGVLGLIWVIALGWMFWWALPLSAALGALVGYIAYVL